MARSDPTGPFVKLSSPGTGEFWKVPILHEDAELFILNKPAKLASSPDRRHPERPSLIQLLHRDIARGAAWARERGITYLCNSHRLEPEASGIMVLAKTRSALSPLVNQFGIAKPLRECLALVMRTPRQDSYECDLKLAPDPLHPGLLRPDPKLGKKSLTSFEVVERFRGWTLLRCFPHTWRAHQIRAHSRAKGHPLAGDAAYSGGMILLSKLKKGYQLGRNDVENPLMGRAALHVSRLTLSHPATGAELVVECPMPQDFEVSIKYLRKFAQAQATPTAAEYGEDEETPLSGEFEETLPDAENLGD